MGNNTSLTYISSYSKAFHSASIIIKSVFLTHLHFNREILFFKSLEFPIDKQYSNTCKIYPTVQLSQGASENY